MNDNDIDTRLRGHGAAWREANHDRPGVDWDVVTATRRWRGWIAVVAVSVAAAAIIVPLALTAGGHATSNPRPATHPSPVPSDALAGAPRAFYALAHGTAVYVTVAGGYVGSRRANSHYVAIGARSNASAAYSALPVTGCRTEIDKIFFTSARRSHVPLGRFTTVPVTTVAGSPASTAMEVSPDGRSLALVQDRVRNTATGQCNKGERLVVLNLVTRRTRVLTVPASDIIQSLQWAPDSRRLAYLQAPACLFGPTTASACGSPRAGTHVTDLAESGGTIGAGRLVLALQGQPEGVSYGPVFWWHGELVTTLNGSLLQIPAHGPLQQVTGNFPKTVDTVSSDPTGNHLLLTSGGTTYRWDNGLLTTVAGDWTQAGW